MLTIATTYFPTAATKLASVMACRHIVRTSGNDFALAGRYLR
jgi:hypothetical protein